MVDESLFQRCSCIDALSFLFDLNELEVKIYFVLVQTDVQTIAELCDIVSRNQSTVYTGVEKLVNFNVVDKTKRGRSGGGYEYVYAAVPPQQVKNLLKNRLDKLYTSINSCLEGFESEVMVTSVDSKQ